MKKVLEQILAERLVNSYLKKKEYRMTDIERSIRQDLESREYYPNDGVYDRTDYFSKRIRKIEKKFENKTDEMILGDNKISLPRPYLLMKHRDENELFHFYKAYIEKTLEYDDKGTLKYRKANYNIDKKIDIDNDYTFVMDVLKRIDKKTKYQDLNRHEKAEEILQLKMYRFCVVEDSLDMACKWLKIDGEKNTI